MSTLFFVSLRKCQHPCRSFFCCFFLFPPRSPIPPPTQLWPCFQFPQCVDRHTHLGDLAFFLCFQVWRRLGMEWEVKGWPCAGCCLGLCQHNLCSVIPFPLDHAKRGGGSRQDSQLAAVLSADTLQSEQFTSCHTYQIYIISWGLVEGFLSNSFMIVYIHVILMGVFIDIHKLPR